MSAFDKAADRISAAQIRGRFYKMLVRSEPNARTRKGRRKVKRAGSRAQRRFDTQLIEEAWP